MHGGHEPLHRHAAAPELDGVRQELAVRPTRLRRGRQTDGGGRRHLVVLRVQITGNAGTVRYIMRGRKNAVCS